MNYWQVKASALERELRKSQLLAQANEVDAAYAKVLTDNGLDPTKVYSLKDSDESITEAPTDGPPAA